MTYQQFEDEVLAKVRAQLPDDAVVSTKPISKNNGVILHGLIINNGSCNISPTIYLDYYFDKLTEGFDVDSIANEIVKQYDQYAPTEDFDISVYTDYERCRSHISYKLINYEKNKELLDDCPHIIYLDLAIVFYCLLSSNSNETSSILIRNSHMELWGVTTDDLFEEASNNTPTLLESEIKNLSEIARELLSDDADPELIRQAEIESPMYVLTNKVKLYGACCILYKNLLEDFANRVQSDLYIIPSSVHEVLLIPSTIESNSEYLSDLVKQVNSSHVEPQEVLSDHVYFYSRAEDAVSY